jgi:hypothetical protein
MMRYKAGILIGGAIATGGIADTSFSGAGGRGLYTAGLGLVTLLSSLVLAHRRSQPICHR